MYVVPHSYPFLTESSKSVVASCFDSDFVGWDAEVDSIILQELSQYIVHPYICTTTSASISLFLVLKYIDLKKSDEIILSAINCWSVYNIIEQENGSPVICDVRSTNDFRASYETIINRISHKTRVIIITHMFGNMIEEKTIRKIKENYPHIYIIEDFSTSFFSKRKKMLGNFSDFTIGSLGSTKPITGGIGGVLSSKVPVFNANYSDEKNSDLYSLNVRISRMNQVLILDQIRNYRTYQNIKSSLLSFYSKYVDVFFKNSDDLFRAITFDDISELMNNLEKKNIKLDCRNSVQPNLYKEKSNNFYCHNAENFSSYTSLPLNVKAYNVLVLNEFMEPIL